jgi:hypothetical protein
LAIPLSVWNKSQSKAKASENGVSRGGHPILPEIALTLAKQIEGLIKSSSNERSRQLRRAQEKLPLRILVEILHDLIRLLMIVNGGCALLASAMGARHQTLIVWDWMDEPGWRWWSSGHVFSNSLPEKFRARGRQLIVLIFAFFATLAVQALLTWLYVLTSTGSAAC